MVRIIIAAGLLALSGAAFNAMPAAAQTRTQQLNHDVQRLWDDTFDPHRYRDRHAWERRREAERRDWCRYHHDFDRCRPYYYR
jgi:hypothetical protein